MHLRVDTSLAQDGLGVAAYLSRSLGLGDRSLAMEFVEVPANVLYGEVERVGGELRSGANQRCCILSQCLRVYAQPVVLPRLNS